MDDDFFKDLVPIKATQVNRAASNNAETSSMFSNDAVLSAVPDARLPAESNKKEGNAILPHPMTGPMGQPKQKKEVQEMEQTMQATFESTFKRFAGGLQKILEDVQQCVSTHAFAHLLFVSPLSISSSARSQCRIQCLRVFSYLHSHVIALSLPLQAPGKTREPDKPHL